MIDLNGLLIVAIGGSGILTVIVTITLNAVVQRAKDRRDFVLKQAQAAADAQLRHKQEQEAAAQKEKERHAAIAQQEREREAAKEAAEATAISTVLKYGLDQLAVNTEREKVWLFQLQTTQQEVANLKTALDEVRAELKGVKMDNDKKDDVIARQAEEIVQLKQEKAAIQAERDLLKAELERLKAASLSASNDTEVQPTL